MGSILGLAPQSQHPESLQFCFGTNKLKDRSRISVWLYEQVNMRIEGCIIGFDEYMNLVLDDAEEVHMKTKNRKTLGRIMLKGDNITLLQSVSN
uniref:Small nuclear ribonucleoprotein E n=1 Tax=Astyanax mexicanus TaxID=7994 RepID=A0A3B1IS25_ASTMX